MSFQIPSLLLLLLPLLINTLPTRDANSNHLIKRDLVSFSSNPRIVRVFSNTNSGQSLVHKFLGNDYSTQDISTGNAQIRLFLPNSNGHTSQHYHNGDEDISRPDCINCRPKPTHRPSPRPTHRPSPRPKHRHKPTVSKPKISVETLKIKGPISGTLEEIEQELEEKMGKHKVETIEKVDKVLKVEKVQEDIIGHKIQIPKYEYQNPNLHVNKHSLNLELNHIFPPPSEHNIKQTYNAEKVRDFSDFDELYDHSKISIVPRVQGPNSKFQANVLSYRANDKTANDFLTQPDPKNPPEPIEKQPNLLFLNDWLEMSNKVYKMLEPEQKRKLYEANKAVIAKAKENGYNTDNNRVVAPLELTKDEYLVTEKNKKHLNKNPLKVDIDPRMGKFDEENIDETIIKNKDNKVANIIPYPPKYVDTHNTINKINKKVPSEYVFVAKTTTKEDQSDGNIIRKNYPINKDHLVPAYLGSNKSPIIKTDKITKGNDNDYDNNDNLGPFVVVESQPGSSTKTIKKTEYISNNNPDKKHLHKSQSTDYLLHKIFSKNHSDQPWINENENIAVSKLPTNNDKVNNIDDQRKLGQQRPNDEGKMITPLQKYEDTSNPLVTFKRINGKNPSEYIIVTNTTTKEKKPGGGYIIRHNITTTTYTINNDDLVPGLLGTNKSDDDKTVKKTEYISNNNNNPDKNYLDKSPNDYTHKTFSEKLSDDQPWNNKNGNLVDSKLATSNDRVNNINNDKLIISKLIQPRPNDGVKVFTSNNNKKGNLGNNGYSNTENKPIISSGTGITTNDVNKSDINKNNDFLSNLLALRKTIEANENKNSVPVSSTADKKSINGTNKNSNIAPYSSSLWERLQALHPTVPNQSLSNNNKNKTPAKPTPTTPKSNPYDISNFLSRLVQGVMKFS